MKDNNKFPLGGDERGRLDIYKTWLVTHAEIYGISENKEIGHYVGLLERAINERMYIIGTGGTQRKKDKDQQRLNAFIVIWKKKYLEMMDSEYTRAFSAADAKIIRLLSVKLEDEWGFAIEKYLNWLFDDFCKYNKKFAPPQIHVASANFVIEKFQLQFKDDIKAFKERKKRQIEEDDIFLRVRKLKRDTNEGAWESIMHDYKNRVVTLSALKVKVQIAEQALRRKNNEQ